METVLLIFIPVAFLALLLRLVAAGMDHNRIDRYIAQQGGHLIGKHWNPFGKGWLGEKDARIYEVRYRDAAGNVHSATCKTSLLGGVYFTQDWITTRLSTSDDTGREARLERENQELRRRIEDLKRRHGQ